MPNPLDSILKRIGEAVIGFSQKRELKAALLDAVKRTPGGGGVNLPKFNHERPNDPANRAALLTMQAVTELLREHPELVVTKSSENPCLCRRGDIALAGAAMGGTQVLDHMQRNGLLVTAGEQYTGNDVKSRVAGRTLHKG